MSLTSGSLSGRIGVDFSRNLTSNVELRGELDYLRDEAKVTVGSSNHLVMEEEYAAHVPPGERGKRA